MRSVNVTMASLLSLLLCVCSVVAHAQPVRISVAEFSKDPASVAGLKSAIDSMRTASDADPMSQEFRTSLAYWANTHGYIGTGTHATSMQKYIIDYRMPQCLQAYPKSTCDAYYKHVVNVDVPPDGYTDSIWGTCQHGNLFFLPWHRFYLHYFERTVRKRMNNPQFALPYWNYFDNYVPTRKGIVLPPLVVGSQNTLQDTWRTPGLNEAKVVMDASSADASQAFSFNDFTNFSNTLQGQPHGAMHCAVGSGCVMPDIGLVPIAGADPVFYMHHANIDRLWQCWMVRKANGQTIDLAWAKANLGMPDSWYEQSYTFIDENGNPVNVKVADVFSAQYTPSYDQLQDCGVNPATKRTLLLATAVKGRSPLMAHRTRVLDTPVTLGNKPVNVSLKPDPAPQLEMNDSVEPTGQSEGHTYLVLEDVTLVGLPALTYKVYIFNKKNPKKASYVATFSFFGTGPAHEGHGDGSSLGDLVYQVSGNLAELGIQSADDIGIRFEPTNLLVGQKLRNQAAGNGVKVGSIRLKTTPDAP
ncbi:MAG: tyrosinase family protein [Xanthomonadaceae bacterium]|nr:tyrosinase family protein [Xanthomonadaceae bacterium]